MAHLGRHRRPQAGLKPLNLQLEVAKGATFTEESTYYMRAQQEAAGFGHRQSVDTRMLLQGSSSSSAFP
jgi:hypothetical protein